MKNIPATILVVDDDKTVVEVASLFLISQGYDVLTASSAKIAEELIKDHRPEIVLLDYKLRETDGVTFLKRVRHSCPETYFILFTGGGSAEIAVDAMKAGAADYVTKPFSGPVLLDKITAILKVRTVEVMNKRLQEEIKGWNLELEKRVNEKAAELEKISQQILQSEKMAILGYLSTGMAHDVRNPLNTINLFIEILKGELEGDEQKIEYLNIISDNARRINNILEKLLETSKRPKYQIKPQDLNEIIRSTISLYEHQAYLQHVEIKEDLYEVLPLFDADYNEIEQLFSNLIINAFHAMKSGGEISIKSEHKNNNVVFTIRDSGSGIKDEDIPKIFDPFFTTKKRTKGSGLGLGVVHRVVSSYHGKVDVDSVYGEYTQFTIKLPYKKGNN